MTPSEEEAVVERAAERIRAFGRLRGHGGSEGFDGPSALDVLEAATGGFGPETVRLARRALERAQGRAWGPETPEHVPADRGVAEYGTGPAGIARPVTT